MRLDLLFDQAKKNINNYFERFGEISEIVLASGSLKRFLK